MNAIQGLLALHQAGIVVDLAGDRIRCRHAPGTLMPDLVAQVARHRAAIIALLADPDVLRLAAAEVIFGAALEEPVIAAVAPDGGDRDRRRCWACGLERSDDRLPCPQCHPPVWMPDRDAARGENKL